MCVLTVFVETKRRAASWSAVSCVASRSRTRRSAGVLYRVGHVQPLESLPQPLDPAPQHARNRRPRQRRLGAPGPELGVRQLARGELDLAERHGDQHDAPRHARGTMSSR